MEDEWKTSGRELTGWFRSASLAALLVRKPHTPRAAHASSPKVRSSGVIDQPSTQSASPPVRQAIKPSNHQTPAQMRKLSSHISRTRTLDFLAQGEVVLLCTE